jgi:glycosyltransferase involved in cell wall biosynthesis
VARGPHEGPAGARVTAVIPTQLARPGLLERALASVRAQRGVDLDVLVVVNRAAPGSRVPALGDDVMVVDCPEPGGASAARNVGAALARTPWVAFLDDDDTWAPDKVGQQVAVARRVGPPVIVGTRFEVILDGRSIGARRARPPRPGEDLSEWLLCARLPFNSGSLGLGSSLLVDVDLVRRCGFPDLPRFQDYDWFLRAVRRHDARFVQLPDPLTRYHRDSDRPHLSAGSWRDVECWVRCNRDLLTPRSAAAALLLTAVRQPDGRRAFRSVVGAAFRHGRPHPLDLVAAVAVAAPGPRRLRRRLTRTAGTPSGSRLRRLRHQGT